MDAHRPAALRHEDAERLLINGVGEESTQNGAVQHKLLRNSGNSIWRGRGGITESLSAHNQILWMQ